MSQQSGYPSGVYCAMLTPANQDESLNLDELERQVERQISAGIDGLFLLGTNGEFYALSSQERYRVTSTAIAAVDGRVPVIVNAGAVTSDQARRRAKAAVSAGADFVAVMTPWFIRCTQAQLARHYLTVADDLSVPVVMYDIPARTGNQLEPRTIEELAGHPNIVALKDSSGDAAHLSRCAEVVGAREGFALLVGSDSLILAGLQMGFAGAVSGLANVAPEWCAGIYQAYAANMMREAGAFQDNVRTLRRIFEVGDGPAMTKLAAAELFPGVGPSRAPARVYDDAALTHVRAVIGSLPPLGPAHTP